MTRLPLYTQSRRIELTIDGQAVSVAEGATVLDACRALGIDVPTLCWAESLTPANVCRVCVVELEGLRTLVPACSRKAEAGMKVSTTSERVKLSRRVVLELLASSVDLSTALDLAAYLERYAAEPERFGPPAPASEHPTPVAGHHAAPDGERAATVERPTLVDNDLFVRDYAKCVLCYKCVQACGSEAQNTFAIAVAGRGFDARIATELDAPLPESACVFCGNCVGVCPTGALMFKREHDLRESGDWDESRQTRTDTICPYCGVGCAVTLHVQDEEIVKVTSPSDSSVTSGHLCIKGRFGTPFVRGRRDS